MLRCASCGSDGLALITDEAADVDLTDIGARSDFTASDAARFQGQPPIAAEDVLAMHTLLAGYRGDIRRLLADDGRGAAER